MRVRLLNEGFADNFDLAVADYWQNTRDDNNARNQRIAYLSSFLGMVSAPISWIESISARAVPPGIANTAPERVHEALESTPAVEEGILVEL